MVEKPVPGFRPAEFLMKRSKLLDDRPQLRRLGARTSTECVAQTQHAERRYRQRDEFDSEHVRDSLLTAFGFPRRHNYLFDEYVTPCVIPAKLVPTEAGSGNPVFGGYLDSRLRGSDRNKLVSFRPSNILR